MAGAVSTAIVAPFDLLESRMVYQKRKGMIQLASQAIRNHGKYNAVPQTTADRLYYLLYILYIFTIYTTIFLDDVQASFPFSTV